MNVATAPVMRVDPDIHVSGAGIVSIGGPIDSASDIVDLNEESELSSFAGICRFFCFFSYFFNARSRTRSVSLQKMVFFAG